MPQLRVQNGKLWEVSGRNGLAGLVTLADALYLRWAVFAYRWQTEQIKADERSATTTVQAAALVALVVIRGTVTHFALAGSRELREQRGSAGAASSRTDLRSAIVFRVQ